MDVQSDTFLFRLKFYTLYLLRQLASAQLRPFSLNRKVEKINTVDIVTYNFVEEYSALILTGFE